MHEWLNGGGEIEGRGLRGWGRGERWAADRGSPVLEQGLSSRVDVVRGLPCQLALQGKGNILRG